MLTYQYTTSSLNDLEGGSGFKMDKLKNQHKWSYWQDLRGSDWDGTQTLKLKTSNKLLLLLLADMVAQWTCGQWREVKWLF